MKITKEEILKSEVRILTLNEPFASLMAFEKKDETRKNPTNVRGLVCIHSAQKAWPAYKVLSVSGHEQYQRIINKVGEPKTQEYIVSIGRLVECRGMTPNDENSTFVKYRDPWIEYNSKGKPVEKRLYMYIFEDMTPITPVKYRGSQGWTFLTSEQKALINPL